MSSRIVKPCAACGKDMFLKPSHSFQKFCSLACRSAGHFEIRTCPECSVPFRVELNRALANRGEFCSRKCQRLANLPEKRFWKKVNKDGQVPVHVPELGPCWVWICSVDELWYGFFRVSNHESMRKAHRASWIMAHGDPGTLLVLHKCDNPSCVRPDHLFLGTNQDNCDDKFRKGREGNLFGSSAPHAKLTEEQVRFIRSSTDRPCALARRFNVGNSTIWNVLRRNSWKRI